MSSVGLDDAVAALRAVAPAPRAERLPLDRALGRVAASPLVARVDVPNLAVAAMDGYACRADDTADARDDRPVRLAVRGGSRTGGPAPRPIAPHEAIPISTGAAMPGGSDAIAVVERAREEGDEVLLFAPALRKHVRRPGEDVEAGVAAIPAGVPLDPVRIGLAAAFGYHEVEVVRRPVVAVLATGPELAPLAADLAPGEVHDSNGPLAAALLRALGAEPRVLPTAVDDEDAVRRALRAAEGADLIVTTGGASVGRYDVVRRVLEADGVLRFDGVRVRPGRPALLGERDGVPWLALPGTPHAVAILGTVLLGAWAHAASGRSGEPPFLRREAAVCDVPLQGDPHRTVLTLARACGGDPDGRRRVAPLARASASRLMGLSEADTLIVLPPGDARRAGEPVEVVPFRALGSLLGG